ncbi:AMP-binding protein [Streptomyces bambusae]|uniref:AMP-binding protein n=1 Tax=Streptomyces bambusae TaxID=1550616 RepID=A0ABS6ZAW7_9ACTN|nr:AMP-binding protein [Streptomyces bambusae]MBW5484887.1 AMP-binding protein [Streptomyces bambusae]
MTQESESIRSGPRTTDTVVGRFEQWARDAPDAFAVLSGQADITYGELDARANRLAHHLLRAGLPAGATVAVAASRRADGVTAVLAALKAGGAYALVDPESPQVAHRQLQALGPFMLITRTADRARLDDGSGLPTICLDAEAETISAHPAHAPDTVPGPTAAVLLTGGARPRAVRVGQARLLAAYTSWAELGGFTPQDRHLITARPDVTAFAAGWTRALCSGGALALPRLGHWTRHEPRRRVEADEVTVVHTDPRDAYRLLGPLPGQEDLGRPEPGLRSLRLLTVTGDRLFVDEQAELHRRLPTGVRLLSVYATTEAAGCGTWLDLSRLPGPQDRPGRTCLLGTPFPGCRAEVRDGQIHLAPPDGGDTVPTGDHGRLRADGLLEYTGRARDRISAAHRTIDAHHAESVVREHPGVGSAIVRDVPGGPSGRRLVAYLALPPFGPPGRRPGLPDLAGLRAYLHGKLPDEEIPSGVVHLGSLPRTRSGREDREALPLPAHPARGGTASKFSRDAGGGLTGAGVLGCLAFFPGLLAFALTFILWPRSVDLTGVPGPWSTLFFLLYVFECMAFGAGVVFLLVGRRPMQAQGRPPRLTKAAHLAVVYLLASWWPQDNLYRLADKYDYPRQALLVYTFNIPLMIAAFVLAVYLTQPSRTDPSDSDDD